MLVRIGNLVSASALSDAVYHTDGQGRTVGFRNTLLILTSNFGAGGSTEQVMPVGPCNEVAVWLTNYSWIVLLLAWGTIAVELIIAYSVIGAKWIKPFGLFAVVVLHSLIEVFLDIPCFALVVVAVASLAIVPTGLLSGSLHSIYSMFVKSVSPSTNPKGFSFV